MPIAQRVHDTIQLLLTPILGIALIILLLSKPGTPSTNNFDINLRNQGIQIYIIDSEKILSNGKYEVLDREDELVIVLNKEKSVITSDDED